jgi:HK97 family phage prohead protease
VSSEEARRMSKMLSGIVGPERRYVSFEQGEVRAEETSEGKLRFRGTAAVFGKRTLIGGKPYGFWESVREGAFTKALAEGDTRMLHNHDPNLLLARQTISEGPGALTMEQNKRGLKVESEWVGTSYARDLHLLVESRAITGMSFLFLPVKEEWSKADDGLDARELIEVKLPDVSTVTFPAYTQTDASVRSAGLGLLMDLTDLPEEQRVQLVSAVRSGIVTPELLPALRAAANALAELADRTQPGEPTGDGDPDAEARRVMTDQIQLRFRTLAARAGDYSRGATRHA